MARKSGHLAASPRLNREWVSAGPYTTTRMQLLAAVYCICQKTVKPMGA
jgi:hypothetical protein